MSNCPTTPIININQRDGWLIIKYALSIMLQNRIEIDMVVTILLNQILENTTSTIDDIVIEIINVSQSLGISVDTNKIR